MDNSMILSRCYSKALNIGLSSLNLSAEFDVVNVRLLLKRLRIIGFPDDLVGLIKDTAIYPATMA